jgi:hypothetical protein
MVTKQYYRIMKIGLNFGELIHIKTNMQMDARLQTSGMTNKKRQVGCSKKVKTGSFYYVIAGVHF